MKGAAGMKVTAGKKAEELKKARCYTAEVTKDSQI
jgi:hypothetical protein